MATRNQFQIRGFAIVAVGVFACAMSAPVSGKHRCEVTRGGQRLALAGGEGAICAAIGKALDARALTVRSVGIEAHERGRFVIRVVMPDGQSLPVLNFARSDAPIGESGLARLAEAVARHTENTRRL